MDLKDWRGTPIHVGSTVTYAVKQSSSVYVNEAVVEEITEERTRRMSLAPQPFLVVKGTGRGSSNWRAHTKRVKLTSLKTVTVLA